ncbi:carboxypeptidase-like regulatory domain-containing protein [Deinococcus peraridilitoris]|uniref:Carboxypeptidase regulatory-like domain-containing protein n=1 Tax=Deinococcus peraridilitoris (strain DSM 19664 / LMG 22246 / CIP 109416 / KR-200) TaxID=937777 RepID=L0A194_DEIPD|nr:carboxypeptidase-like regulatory domain-containing protein [Deinococcus peraridilitoris]AFZ67224.1 hypothetical protein Deipe_1698 [Deinococcus peraridilitoris DSM 19664]
MASHRALAFIPLTLLSAGLCFSADATSASSVKAKPGMMTGRITTTAGKPLAGAVVNVFGFTKAGEQVRITARTGADGIYAVNLPPGGLYGVSNAFAPLKTALGVVDHRLHPLERNFEVPVSNAGGITRNFELRLSGLKAVESNVSRDPREPTNYYGQLIRAHLRGGSSSMDFQGTMLEFKLTPVGSLADGTKGKTLIFRRSAKHLNTDTGLGFDLDQTQVLPDVPLGAYKATATVKKPGGTPQNILLSRDGNTPGPSITVEFRPSPSVSGTQVFNLYAHLDDAGTSGSPAPKAPPVAQAPKTSAELIRGHVNSPFAYPGNVLLVLEDYAVTPEDAVVEVVFTSLDGGRDEVVRRTLRQIRAGNMLDDSRPLAETGYIPLLTPGAYRVSAVIVSAHGAGRKVELRPSDGTAGREVQLRWMPGERYRESGGKVVYVTINPDR